MPTVSTIAATATGTVGTGDHAAATPTRTNQAGTRARQRNTRAGDNVFMNAAYSLAGNTAVPL